MSINVAYGIKKFGIKKFARLPLVLRFW